jgi:aspartate carbamoyltransferase catalytic subunit
MQKGESLKDTILTIKAMQVHCLVVRHKQSGIAESIAKLCGDDLCLINAGDGTNAHPTQGLLDVFTILQHKPNLANLKIAIVGDIVHSRVAKSQIAVLQKLGCTNIHIIGPETLLPKDHQQFKSVTFHSGLSSGVKDADVVSCLRLQKERMQHTLILDDQNYFNQYGITNEVLKLAKPNAIVIHPGPINREIEISSEVADGPQSVILEQVTNGVAIRMAIFDLYLNK